MRTLRSGGIKEVTGPQDDIEELLQSRASLHVNDDKCSKVTVPVLHLLRRELHCADVGARLIALGVKVLLKLQSLQSLGVVGHLMHLPQELLRLAERRPNITDLNIR